MYTKLTLFLTLFFIGIANSSFGQCSSEQTTINFSPSGSIEQFVVPNGVTSITMVVKGGDGGNTPNFNGGEGSTVTATFSVTPGEILDVVVGLAGGTSSITTGGGGGGGGSGVRRNSSSSLLIVGGAGSGAGETGGGDGGFGVLSSPPSFGILATFGAGSSANPNLFGNSIVIPGGFGVGGGTWGYSSMNLGVGGGSGGYVVSAIGSAFGDGGQPGYSFRDLSGLNSSEILGSAAAGTQSNGEVTFCFVQPIVDPIPTMSQWGLIIFGLLITNLGIVILRRKEEILV